MYNPSKRDSFLSENSDVDLQRSRGAPRRDECVSALQFSTVRSTTSTHGSTPDCLLTTSTAESWRSAPRRGGSTTNDNKARQLEEILCTFDTPVNLDSLFIAVENSRSVSQVPSKIDVYVATSTGGWALSGSLNFSDATSTRDFPNHFCTRKITSCLDVTKVLLRLHPSHERGDLPFCITHLKPFGKAVSVHHTVTPPSMNPFVSPPQPLVSSSSAPHHWQQPQQQLQRSLPPPYSALHQQHYPRLLPSLPQEGGAHHGAYSDPGAPTITFPNLSHQQAFGGDGHGQADSHRYGLLPPRPAPLAPLNKPPQRHARTAASDDPRIAQRGNIPFTSENSTLRHRAAALLREQQIINNVNPELSRHPSAFLMDTHRSQDDASYSRNSSETTSQYVHTIDECQRQLTRKKASAIEVDDLETAEKCHDLLTNLSSLRSLVADLDMRKRHAVGVDDYRTAKECKARLLVAMEKVENIQQEMRKRAEPPQERVLELFSGKPPTLLSNAPTAASSQFPMTDDGVGEVNYKGLDNASETSSVGPSVSVAMHGIESPSQPMPAQQPLPLEQQKAVSATIISNPAQEPLSPTPLTSRMSACGSERHNSENRRLQEHPPHTTVDLRRVNYDDTAAVVPAQRPRTVDAVAIDAPGTIGILEAMPLSSFPVLTQLNDETPIPLTFPTPRDMLPGASISMLDQSQFCHASPSTSSLLLFRKLQEEDTRSSTSVAIRSDGSSSSSTAAVKKAHKAQPLLANLKKKVVRVDVELSSNDTRHRPSIPDPSMVTRENTGNFSRRVSEADIEVNGKEHSSTIRWNKQEHPMMAFVESFVKTAAADSSSAAPIPPDVMIAEALAGVVVSKAEQEGDPLERSARSAQLVINASSITGWGLFVGTFGMDGARCLFTRAHPRVREAAVKALLDDDVVTRILSSGIVSDQRFQEALVVYISGHNAGYGVLDPVAPIFLANLQHFGNLRQLQYAKFLSPSQRNLSTLVASLASRLGETNARVRTVAFEELITTAELLLPDDNSDDEDSKVPRLEPLSGANVVESVAYAVVVNQHPDAVGKDGGGNAEGGSPSPAKSKLGLTNVNFAVNRLGVATALLGVFVEYCFWDRDAQEEYHCNTIFRVGHSPASKKNQPSGTPSLDGIFENYFPSLYPPLLVSNLVTPLLNHRNEAVRKAAVGLLAKIWYVYLAFPRIQRGEGKGAQPRSRAAIDNAVNSLKPAQKKQFDEVVKEEMSKMPSTESDSDSDAESEKDWGMTASPPSGLRERNVGLVVKKGTLHVPAAKASPNSSSSSPRVGEMTARPNGRQNGLSDLQFTLNAKRGVGLEQSHKTTTQIEAEMRAFAKTKKKTLEETLKENPDLAEDFFIGVGKDRNKAPPAQAVKSPPLPPEVPRVDKKPEVDDDLRQRLAQRRASTRNTKVISSAPLGHHPDESPPLTPTLSDNEHEETEGHLGPSHPRTVGIHRTRSDLLREKVARELEAELLQGGPLSPRYESSPESCKVKRGSAYDHAVNPLPPRRPSPEPTPGKCQFCGIEDPLLTNEDELLDHFKFECVMLSPCPLCMLAVEIREMHWHMTQDCSLRGRVHQCPKCLEAVAAADFVPHVNQNTCKKYALQDAKCPLCDEIIGPDDAKWRTHFSGSTCCKENPRSALSDQHLLHKKSNSQIGLLPAAGIDISNASQPPKKSVTFGSNTQHHASISDEHQFQEVTKEEISQEVSEL